MGHIEQLPRVILDVIRRGSVDLSAHADENLDRYGYTWDDILSLAESAHLVKKERDPRRVSSYVYSVTGRDASGRDTYMAGKLVESEVPYWYVITIHPAP